MKPRITILTIGQLFGVLMCLVSDSERGQSSANDPVTISPAGS
jgi:hypothetical protein